jgi:chromosome segregation ATPase
MNNLTVDQLKDQIAQKMRYIEQFKQEQDRKVQQLKAKFDAEINGIESKIGAIVQQRTAMLEQKQTAEKQADLLHEKAKAETRKAQQSLAEVKKLVGNTRRKQELAFKTAEKAAQQEFNQAMKAAQNEIKTLQKQIAAVEKAMIVSPVI